MHIVLSTVEAQQRKLLDQLGVAYNNREVRIAVRADQFDTLLLAARVHCLSKIERYFLQHHSDLLHPVNVRNEAAAISLLLTHLKSGDSNALVVLKQLAAHCESLWPEFAWGDINLCGHTPPLPTYPADEYGPEAAFESWALSEGIQAGIRLASFNGLRGCAASQDLRPGDKVLSIPKDSLIYEDTVKQTDLGSMLSAIPGLRVDNMLILFTMIDRHDPDSKWAPLWASLPAAYYTGMSFPEALVADLAGTAAQLEIQKAQAHLRAQYTTTRPLFEMLLTAYPQHLQASWFEYDAYLWAAELWYSYAFEVEFPGREEGSSIPVMVPFACHVNHSPWPHVVRYGRVNPETDTLDYPAFRPCQEGQQVFISYGPVPNLKLLCYYGFVIPNNPHDLVLLQLEPPEEEVSTTQQAALDLHGLTLEHNLQDGPLSKQLLACLRVIVGSTEELQQVIEGRLDPLQQKISDDNEEQALSMLEAALRSLLEPLRHSSLLLNTAREDNTSQQCIKPVEQQRDGVEAAAQQGVARTPSPNENGLDSDWVASRGFCAAYVRGQVHILERSLEEIRKLAGSS